MCTVVPVPVPGIRALYTASNPNEAASPYHAFAACPPSRLFAVPSQWPGPRAEPTTARLLWSETALYVCYECEGQTAEPIQPSQVGLVHTRWAHETM